MREMKDSGVEWLGEVPAEWGFDRLGGFFSLRSEKVSDEDYAPLSVTKGGVVPQLSHVAKSDDHANRKLVCKGDFAINSRSDRRNSCGFASQDGSVSLINTICVPRGEIESRYFGYLFDSSQWSDEFYSWGHGIVADLWTTGWNDMKKILLPVPPLHEQRHIADFLDEKCAEIDRAVSAAERSVQEYVVYKKGLVTEAVRRAGGKEVRLRHLCSRVFDGPFGSHLKSADYIDEGIRVVRLENLRYMSFDDSKRSYVSQEKYETIARHTVMPTDLIMATFVAKEVQVASLPKEVQFAVNKADCVGLRLKSGVCVNRYVQYALSSNVVLDYLRSNLHGTTRDRVNTSQIKEIPLAVPSLDEQLRIADFLDEKCVQIDAAIAAKQAIIADLKAYKQSLIYEVVTGKREV
ncbi:MAG: restriction endonuclease subunit S [Ellagibacter isourolithinifaciens]|uniref:restriction endonuclease subunit S n=2 Tax=Coriobacteriia TaxID=84998 RepID=UPI0023F318B3|nr:restriction endonuclease subunit S [Ellagibacter isourolithinifaciens]MDD7690935.1 restriction endonuclease subunit S [Ellagibacter isourolithinifaciens]